ncbi:hypothetical protein [Bradyrhizobium erythrophlei]|uniref:Uncharacterized protein n=1 Tax=Bradyrhizobium erythrophlei TaxID=1437360 RepID=A0A1H4NHZ6_9BRAD|nr:hypothetical protein [Bradyrhizobium erythrophlei]SEB94847.1 hypothetical protein SAMN05444164_0636 [Bradyrhizobium erythrophlei]
MTSWLDAMMQRATESLRDHPEVPARPRALTTPKPEIKHCWVQTRRPDYERGDEGNVEPVYYSVSDGVLSMHDEKGRSTGQQALADGEDPRLVAMRLRWEAWQRTNAGSDFNRPLVYSKSGMA